jgi:hypothetical protein
VPASSSLHFIRSPYISVHQHSKKEKKKKKEKEAKEEKAMASIPSTVQLSSNRSTMSRRSPSQGPGKGEAAAGELRTPLLGASGDVQTTDRSQMPHTDASKAKKKGNRHGVEALDVNVKLSNSLSSRLRKFGFPKLSGVFA